MGNSLLDDLIKALTVLPGTGERSARRLAYHLLYKDRQGAQRLLNVLNHALSDLKHCHYCHNFTEHEVCNLCVNPKRDKKILCVVETPIDQNRIEESHSYRGLYFVLMGRLNPIEGTGPRDIAFEQLMKRIHDGVVEEVIIGTSFTNEGELTAHHLAELIKLQGSIKVSRIARGIPSGGELEYVDASTLAWALTERQDCS